ncbi:hypothetical protein D3C76_1278120 [compost metagenome]
MNHNLLQVTTGKPFHVLGNPFQQSQQLMTCSSRYRFLRTAQIYLIVLQHNQARQIVLLEQGTQQDKNILMIGFHSLPACTLQSMLNLDDPSGKPVLSLHQQTKPHSSLSLFLLMDVAIHQILDQFILIADHLLFKKLGSKRERCRRLRCIVEQQLEIFDWSCGMHNHAYSRKYLAKTDDRMTQQSLLFVDVEP